MAGAPRECLLVERTLSCSAALQALVQAQSRSLNTVRQGAWALLLERFGGGSDVVFGAVRSGRKSSVPDAAHIVGCLINTLPVRVTLPGDAPAIEWLRHLHERERCGLSSRARCWPSRRRPRSVPTVAKGVACSTAWWCSITRASMHR
jgi:hypothetical protein